MRADETEMMDALRRRFPACVTEAQAQDGQLRPAIDFDLLRQELSDRLIDGPAERYQLTWPGKRAAMRLANEPCGKTLRPCCPASVNFETTNNLFIEGDNLDALKLLQETYLARVKAMYIDPPYNTGKDFVYKDNWKTPLKEYLRQTGQLDANGRRVQTAETNGRHHSRWLSMMYPRLYLARQLLTEDGVIFISIDDHEQHNLRHLCDDIFGEENFIAIFVRKIGASARMDATHVSNEQEYVIAYAKDLEECEINQIPSANVETYKLVDKHESRRGKYTLDKLDRGAIQGNEKLQYPITAPDGSKIYPGGEKRPANWFWRWSEKKFQWGIENDYIVFRQSRGGGGAGTSASSGINSSTTQTIPSREAIRLNHF